MKRLLVRPYHCTGCRSCEIACAFSHPAKGGAPGRSAIRAFSIEPPKQADRGEFGIPVVCLQCDRAACVTVCPTAALERDVVTGAVAYIAERCIKCRACAAACPFGNIVFDEPSGKVVKCDLCKGEPRCAQFCPTQTLQYI